MHHIRVLCEQEDVICTPSFGEGVFHHCRYSYVEEHLPSMKERHVLMVNFPFLLSDAFHSQVWVGKGEEFKPVSFPTFGSEPGRIMTAVMEMKDSVGSLSKKTHSDL